MVLIESALDGMERPTQRSLSKLMEQHMSDIDALPPSTDARWLRVVEGKITRPWSNLAMKILMTRIVRETARDPSSANVQKCANEIHAFFQKNLKIASDDLAAVLH